jgi:small redox-active disulfide protein 2
LGKLTDQQINKSTNICGMEIKILGTGCPKCKTLEKLTRDVVEQNGFTATITKVEDIMDIMKYNIMATPALVVNEKVEIKGRVPSAEEIKQVLSKY